MGAEPSPRGRPSHEILASIARWLLGGLFIYLGVSKILHPAEFLAFVRQQMSVTNPSLAGLIAGVAPWLEVLYGMWLISGIARNTAALLGRWWLGAVFIYMGLNKALPNPEAFLKLVRQYQMVPFTVVVLKRALAIAAATGKPLCAVKFDCGCGAGEVYICHKLIENSALLLLAAWLLMGRGRQLCLRFSLRRAEDQGAAAQPELAAK
jgi:uncharacterized membrane protein YphA (DoxX/SURF4 family)